MAKKSVVQELIDELRVEANALKIRLEAGLELIERLESDEKRRLRKNKVRPDSGEGQS